MHQTVYNTYQSLLNLDFSRILELTDPFGPDQIKRMAIHNDILLALLAPLYFIYSGPETLLIVQTVVIALGALAVYGIAQFVFNKNGFKNLVSLVFAAAYLLYPPLQRMNIYDFHAVALATTFLLFMFYFWLKKRYIPSFLFFLLSIISKEQVALTTLFFGLYALYTSRRNFLFSLAIISLSIIWFLASVLFVIPYFRGEAHFALEYYEGFNPANLMKNVFHIDTLRYFFFLFGPLGFLSFFSPLQFLIALPEFAINLLSNSWNMRNIIFHYTAVIQPFVFISAIYGTKKSIEMLERSGKRRRIRLDKGAAIALFILFFTLIFALSKGPLPFSREQDIHPLQYPQVERNEIVQWKQLLQNDAIKVSTTGQLAPHFTSRRYFYTFSEYYYLADYIVLRLGEIYNYPEKDTLIPLYAQLVFDPRFEKVYKKGDFEVYKKTRN